MLSHLDTATDSATATATVSPTASAAKNIPHEQHGV